MSRSTPWGSAQSTRTIAPGIISVSTASHGGIHLDAELNQQVPLPLRSSDGWYEEDCEWACAAVTFPEHFSGRECYYATRTVEHEHPGARSLIPKEAYRRGDDWYLANSRKWCVGGMGTHPALGPHEWLCLLERVDRSESVQRVLTGDEAFGGPFDTLPGKPFTRHYVIRNESDAGLAWSNKTGWVSTEAFDVFDEHERSTLRLPIGGRWVELD